MTHSGVRMKAPCATASSTCTARNAHRLRTARLDPWLANCRENRNNCAPPDVHADRASSGSIMQIS